VALFWIVNKHAGEPRVFLEEAGNVVHARLAAGLKGHDGDFIEAHALGAAVVRKIPKKFIGRVLTAKEAAALLERMG
jgi:hypothetical protein